MNKEEFYEALSENLVIELDSKQKKQLDKFYKLLIEWNQKINLTAIKEEKDVYLKHFYDSLTVVKSTNLKRPISLCDVGSGAGFPGIVLKIVFPNLKVTLVDSLNKRVMYLQEIIKELGLENIEAVHSRMEDYSRLNKEKFNVITARAVADLNTLVEISINSLRVGGKLVFMKANCKEEIANLRRIASKLNIMVEDVNNFRLPIEESARTLISVIKLSETKPIYPRTSYKIKKNPL